MDNSPKKGSNESKINDSPSFKVTNDIKNDSASDKSPMSFRKNLNLQKLGLTDDNEV